MKARRESESQKVPDAEPGKSESSVPKEAPQAEASMTESMLSLADFGQLFLPTILFSWNVCYLLEYLYILWIFKK